MISKVLFPVDFSMVSEYAFSNCIPRFFSTGVAEELILIHVLDVQPTGDVFVDYDKMQMKAKEKLDKVAKEFRDMGINVAKTVVRMGHPALEIAKVAEEENVDIIYMPSKGEHIVRDMLIGHTAANVARVATKPVLLVKYEWDKARHTVKCIWDARRVFDKPLIALDFSPCSDSIVETVKELFEDYVKKATLMHVIDYGKPDKTKELSEEALKKLEEFAKKFKFESDLEVSAGVASNAIINEAVIKGSTLIVVGKRGRSVLKDLLLGSTADGVIRRSMLPVLLVPCKY